MTIFDLLWRAPAGGRRGPRPSLTREGLIQAAMELADREGLEAVTMQRLAAALGSKPMTLYRYLPGKEAILALMWDAALGAAPTAADGDWRTRLSAWGAANLARLERHPWMIELVGSASSVGPNWTGWLDVGLAALSDLPLTVGEKLATLTLVDGHLRSAARLRFGVKTSPEWAADFGRMLGIAAAGDAFPTLGAMARNGDSSAPAMSMEEMFEFGLERILDGIAELCRRRGALG